MTQEPTTHCKAQAAKRLREQARERLEAGGAAAELDRFTPATPEAWREELRLVQIERDIQTEALERARDELARVQDGYRGLFERTPVAYVILDEHGVIRDANPPAAELLGAASVSELPGQGFAEFLAPSAVELWERHQGTARSGAAGLGAALELVLHCDQCPLRRLVRLECITGDVPAHEGHLGLFALIDLTEQRQVEQDREALIDLVEAAPQALARRLGIRPLDDAEGEPSA